ncbi:MAG: polyphosphate kinase 2 family protein [Gammaproteobacteria bacterium]|nr:polyphosphate kinase 2 family protein [Gammaproteobacteria bacterium]
MFKAPDSPWLVPFDGSFRVADTQTQILAEHAAEKPKKRLKKHVKALRELQHILFAHDRYALLLVFQAMDAAGKDGTIRAVMSGVNPAGCQVYSFRQPSAEELDHEFLWRTARRLPERGRIGIFNRSYYEEVLVVRVHPKFLGAQRLPDSVDPEELWQQRFASIRDHELHLARNGTVIIKFWLNVSFEEQRQRFLARLDDPEKHWKFSVTDVAEREHWPDYMHAYEAALNATSRPWAPWYAIPADDKRQMRVAVAAIIRDTLVSLGLRYPDIGEADKEQFATMRDRLENE